LVDAGDDSRQSERDGPGPGREYCRSRTSLSASESLLSRRAAGEAMGLQGNDRRLLHTAALSGGKFARPNIRERVSGRGAGAAVCAAQVNTLTPDPSPF